MSQGAASRKFRLGLGVRSFQAGRRLPFNLSSVFVQVTLPAGLVDIITESGVTLPDRSNPFRTEPAVDVARGSDVSLPAGQVSLEFSAGLMRLAAMLAHEPRLTAEVWHKVKFQQDTLLGVASIPLSPLLQESWVQGTAPVLAVMTKANSQTQDRVQVGSLRMVLSLEELGPAVQQRPHQGPEDTATAAAAAAAQPTASLGAAAHPSALPTQGPLAGDQQAAANPVLPFQHASGPTLPGNTGIAGGQMTASSSAGSGLESPPLVALAASAPAPLAAAPEQALKAEASETASEPDRLFAPDFIISQVEQFTNALQRQSAREEEGGEEEGGLPEAAEDLADEMAVAALSRTITSREDTSPGAPDLQRNSSGIRRQSSSLRRPSFGRQNSDRSPSGDGLARADSGQGRLASPELGQGRGGSPSLLPQPQEQDLQAAWELEVWKNAEEVKWRAELRERELERMSGLEGEWRRREAARTAEVSKIKAHYANLDTRTRQILSATEEREKQVVALEEELARRRRDLEHEHSSRLAEAEATVRRLQADFEHQVKLERQLNTDLQRQHEQLTQAKATARAECAAIEREFSEYRAAQRSTPEADLVRQLADAREQVRRTEAKAEKATAAKQSYKEQVLKLAQDLGSLQRQVAQGQAAHLSHQKAQLDDTAVRLAAQEAALRSSQQRQQLSSLRAQLNALQHAPAAAAQQIPAHHTGQNPTLKFEVEMAQTGGAKVPPAHEKAPVAAKPVAQMEHVEEAKRLLSERSSLLKTGSYSKESAVIQQLDAKIQELGNKALGTWTPSS